MIWRVVICVVIGYFFGCISTGELLGKLFYGIDLKKYGSGNIGTTNALRTLGPMAGILTLIGDMLKAIIPIILFRILFRNTGISSQLITLYTGLGVVIGHNFPFYLKFKGGKGIAATAGMITAFGDWKITIICLLFFIAAVIVTRYVSLGSLIVSVLLPIGIFVFYRTYNDFWQMFVLTCIFMLLAFYKHKENIERLLHGTERKLNFHKEQTKGEKKDE